MKYAVQHPILGNTNAAITYLSGGPDAEVEQTLFLMRKYAIEDSRSPEIQKVAAMCGYGDPGVWAGQYCQRVYEWVRGNLRFLNDEPLGAPLNSQVGLGDGDIVEVLIRPVDMVGLSPQARIGDCDDYSMMVSALLCVAGIKHSFVVVATDPRDLNRFSHVYVVAEIDDSRYGKMRIPIDASHGPHYRWEVPQSRVARLQYYPVMRDDSVLTLFAMAGVFSFGFWALWKLSKGVM